MVIVPTTTVVLPQKSRLGKWEPHKGIKDPQIGNIRDYVLSPLILIPSCQHYFFFVLRRGVSLASFLAAPLHIFFNCSIFLSPSHGYDQAHVYNSHKE